MSYWQVRSLLLYLALFLAFSYAHPTPTLTNEHNRPARSTVADPERGFLSSSEPQMSKMQVYPLDGPYSSMHSRRLLASPSPAQSSIESDQNDYALYEEWLRDEGSQATQRLIQAYRRTGSGSGSGATSAPTVAPSGAPSVAPSGAPSVAPSGAPTEPATTVDITASNTQEAKQTLNIEVSVTAADYNGPAGETTRQVVTCSLGKKAGTMTQGSDGVCAHNTGCDTVTTAAPARRGAVVITVKYYIDPATSSVTLTAVVASADAITATSLAAAVEAVIEANPAFAGVTAPTILSIQQATVVEKAADDDSNSSGILIAVIIVCVLLVIAAGIGGFVYYRKTHEAESDHAPMETEMQDAPTETILIQQAPGGIAPGVLYSVEFDNGNNKSKEIDL